MIRTIWAECVLWQMLRVDCRDHGKGPLGPNHQLPLMKQLARCVRRDTILVSVPDHLLVSHELFAPKIFERFHIHISIIDKYYAIISNNHVQLQLFSSIPSNAIENPFKCLCCVYVCEWILWGIVALVINHFCCLLFVCVVFIKNCSRIKFNGNNKKTANNSERTQCLTIK